MSKCSVSRAAGHGRLTEPLVSVVMNGFNSARYLSEAIASLRAQTYERWELVFWDNRSEDKSAAIVRACDDPRIRFHCAPRRMSLAEGRNAAIAQAHGGELGVRRRQGGGNCFTFSMPVDPQQPQGAPP